MKVREEGRRRTTSVEVLTSAYQTLSALVNDAMARSVVEMSG